MAKAKKCRASKQAYVSPNQLTIAGFETPFSCHLRADNRLGCSIANVEFGAKVQVSMMNGFAFLDDLSWEAFNEGTRLIHSVEKYHQRMGYYPKRVMADKIYCTRENRRLL